MKSLQHTFRASIMVLLLSVSSALVNGQSVSIPEEIKTKCPDIPLKERVRITVAEFAFSASGKKSDNVDNFSSMLSNALVNVNCYRVLSMLKDSSQLEGGQGRSLKPQAIVTGEITEYSHTTTTKDAFIAKSSTTTAHIGYIIQIKNNHTGDILFSESRNVTGSASNKSLQSSMKSSPFGGRSSIGSNTKGDNVAAAYQNALERAIIEAVEVLVDKHERLVRDLIENSPNGEDKPLLLKTTTVIVRQATFQDLHGLQTKLQGISWVKDVQKKLLDDQGELIVRHSGSNDDLVMLILAHKPDRFIITGFDQKKISVIVKDD